MLINDIKKTLLRRQKRIGIYQQKHRKGSLALEFCEYPTTQFQRMSSPADAVLATGVRLE
jgi:hypothetical protein